MEHFHTKLPYSNRLQEGNLSQVKQYFKVADCSNVEITFFFYLAFALPSNQQWKIFFFFKWLLLKQKHELLTYLCMDNTDKLFIMSTLMLNITLHCIVNPGTDRFSGNMLLYSLVKDCKSHPQGQRAFSMQLCRMLSMFLWTICVR